MPKITWPTCVSMLLAETTRAKAGNFISSCSCGRHFLSSDKSRLVPNLIVLYPCLPRPFLIPSPRCEVPTESFESESESRRWPPTGCPPLLIFSCSSYRTEKKFQLVPRWLQRRSSIYLKAFLEARGLVLGIFSNCSGRSMRNARPSSTTYSRVPVLIRRLLQLGSHFDWVVRISFD